MSTRLCLCSLKRLEGHAVRPTPNTTTSWQSEDEEKCILSLLDLEPIHVLVGKKLKSYYPCSKIFPHQPLLICYLTEFLQCLSCPLPTPPPPNHVPKSNTRRSFPSEPSVLISRAWAGEGGPFLLQAGFQSRFYLCSV